MRAMIYFSLILNIGILIPVCGGLLADAAWTTNAYGGPSAARQILLSVYLAIALMSVLLLVRSDPRMVATLLLVQVVYKLATPLLVGDLQNPVVLSNIGISVVHMVTLARIWRATGHAPPAR
ncbi:MAG: hypothetical protein K2X32_11955 [Phycisphaerales bacterium]|nr:hypothetical protein [Phycisphaerales bacterium]